MNDAHRVLVADKLAPEGLAVFQKAGPRLLVEVKVGLQPADLVAAIGQYDALAVRSATQVTAEVLAGADRLRVVGRAGIGVDNIDVPAATKKGVVVMNTPEGNVTTTAEHAIALMCSLARRIPQATASMKLGKWEKTKFQGRELYGKTVGIVGLGNIGKIVARLAQGLQMRVVAFDPYVTTERAREIGVELLPLEALLASSDFVTVHMALVEATRNIISKSAIEKMKKGSYLINAARGGLVDELAVAEALKSGKLAGAAFDVFVEEPPPKDHPFFALENVILTPHLGASTDEAQVNVSIAVAEQIVDYLLNGVVRNAVNAPNIAKEHVGAVGPYARLGRKMGSFAGQMHPGSVRKVRFVYEGAAAELPTASISVSMLTGLLKTHLGDLVNEVNAPIAAKERGIEIGEERTTAAHDFVGRVLIRVTGDRGETEIVGALFGSDEPRIVAVNGVRLEIVPEGHLLISRHRDKPGMIGKIGTVLGQHGINISRLVLGGARESREEAQAVLSIGAAVAPNVLAEIEKVEGIQSIRHFDLG
jgi:D-3-phosphoglycerate dehydrogenase / 2-oxoglutarate reductase